MMLNILLLCIFLFATSAFYYALQVVTRDSLPFKVGFKSIEKAQYSNLDEILRANTSQYILATIAGIFGVIILSNFGPIIGLTGFLLFSVPIILVLKRREKARRKQLETQLVITLNLLSNAMRAGKTLVQSLEEVAYITPWPISHEISLISRRVRVGTPTIEALEDFAKRFNMKSINLAVKAMTTSIKTGSNLPKAMKSIANTIASALKVAEKIRVLTVQSRFQSLLIGCIPLFLAMVFYYISPEYITILFQSKEGNLILFMIVLLQTIGFFVVKRIMAIEI
jgi:tight adherence protein B